MIRTRLFGTSCVALSSVLLTLMIDHTLVSPSSATAAVEPAKITYKVVDVGAGGGAQYEKALNDMASQGWELVAYGHYLIFKKSS